ncbi:MAG: magnesium chelatase domain-containing protein [Oscillospiraceae bacterium]
MLSKIQSLGCRGVTGYAVSVECHVSNGLPGFDIVGLPDAAVKEARERVRSAIKTNGMKFPVSRLTVNLAPADTRKAGTLYDLPVLLGILCATGEIRQPPATAAFLGEVSLAGRCAPSPARSRWRSRPSRSASRSSMSRRATRPRPPLPTA